MANTIGFGQGAVNNTNGFGKAPTNNTIDFGEICADSWSPETNLVGGSSFTNTQSVELDGVDDYVDCGNVTTLNGQTNITISLWFKQDSSVTGIQYPITKYGTGGNQLLVTYRVGGVIDVNLGGVGLFRSANAINYSDGNWHNMVITYDSSRTNIYNRTAVSIDNVDIAHSTFSQSSTTITTSTANLNIGARTGYGFYEWNGKLDEVAIWNRTLTPTEITEIYNNGVPTDLSSYSPNNWWRFEGTGTTATDSGTGANDGTLTNGATRSTDVPT